MNTVKFAFKRGNKYYFSIVIDDIDFYFYTFKDLSGYGIDACLEKSEYFIMIGTAILTNQDYIKKSIKEA